MFHELPAANDAAHGHCDIGAANHVDLWPCRVKVPTQLEDVCKSLRVIRVHMREEDRIETLDRYAHLRKSHVGPAAGVELHSHRIAVVAVVTVLEQRPRTGQPIERWRAAP
jgi:hypothetical protein